jgi:phenylacetate-CoA ligase
MQEIFHPYLEALGRIERLPLPELARYQEALLARLVRHAHDRLDFYRARLACLFGADGELDLTRWNSVPVLDRLEASTHGPDMRVRDLPTEYGAIGESTTSGSTGIPLQIASNGLVFVAANALFTRMARCFGLDTARPLAAIRYLPERSMAASGDAGAASGWSFADQGAPLYEIDTRTPLVQQIEWLAAHKAPYLLTQPSAMLAIAEAVTPQQGRALGIEMVFLAGETISDSLRTLIAERLGARVAGLYSCNEIGTIAWECEAAPHYHVAVENALVEILDDAGRDVAPGGRGQVVVTGFYNYAMPFIRYAVGDIAVAGTAPCPCGRAAPVIARIEGRVRNEFVFRDGTRVVPRESTIWAMQAFVPLRRYQLIQLDHEQIELRYLPDGSGRAPDLAGLQACARRMLHPSVRINLVAVDCFETSPSGKFEEFISLVPGKRLPGARDSTGRTS